MKDIRRFTLSLAGRYYMLTLIIFIFMSLAATEISILNWVLAFIGAVLLNVIGFAESMMRGSKDVAFGVALDKQKADRNVEPSKEELERTYRPAKGLIAGFIAVSPVIIMAIVAMIIGDEGWEFVIRLFTGGYAGFYVALGGEVNPMLYLPLSLLFPLCAGIGYRLGPNLYQKGMKPVERMRKRVDRGYRGGPKK